MKKISGKVYILLSVLICAIVMSYVDAVVQPGYAVKSGIKAALFLLIPMLYFIVYEGSWNRVRSLFALEKKELVLPLALGACVYILIVGGYLLLRNFWDISDMVLEMTSDAGVSAGNFLYVSLYISLVNSFLEEFLFRGFGFLTLKKHISRRAAYLFSALTFAAYHFGMMAVGTPLLLLLAFVGLFLGGCVFNWLNERAGNIVTSWLVHMCANFAINTIGFMIFGII